MSTRSSSRAALVVVAIRLLLAAAVLPAPRLHAAPVDYGDVGTGPFGSLSWVTRDYHDFATTRYDGGPLKFLSGQSDGFWHSHADASFNGQASSSLLDGSLHAGASAGAWGPAAAHLTSSYRASAGTAMWDRVAVNSEPGTHLIPLRMHVDGSATDPAWAQVRFYVGPSDPFTQFALQPFQGWHTLAGHANGRGERGWDTVFDLGSLVVDGAYEDWTFNVYFELVTFALSTRSTGGAADFSHTARFAWDLPDGVSVQSASGRFMAGSAQAVPEPGGVALALLALTLVPVARRRRR
ncbi:MAG: hypothetical protein U1F56_09175 [Rubrivivax sp.]